MLWKLVLFCFVLFVAVTSTFLTVSFYYEEQEEALPSRSVTQVPASIAFLRSKMNIVGHAPYPS